MSQALTTDLQNQTMAALIDPFGTNTFRIATQVLDRCRQEHVDARLQRTDVVEPADLAECGGFGVRVCLLAL